MKSPIDGSEMTAFEYEGALIYTCTTSGGELVGPDALAHIVNTRQQRFGPEWESLVADHEPLRGIPGDESERKLVCPCCASQMVPVNYGTDTAVIIDRCDDCGAIWLDAHELEMIQALMEAWQDHAPASIRAISFDLEDARRKAAAKANDAFHASRFSFINALFNRLLDAA